MVRAGAHEGQAQRHVDALLHAQVLHRDQAMVVGHRHHDEDDPLGAGDAAEPPVPTLKTQPIYPSALLKKSIGGKVLVTAVVNISGQVIKATIKQSSGQSELDKAAVQAVLKWKFKPGKKNGKPVQATCLIPYTFEVKKN